MNQNSSIHIEKEKVYLELDSASKPKKLIEDSQQSIIQLIFPDFKYISFVFFLSIFQILIFLSYCIHYFFASDDWECILYDWGANYEPSIRHNYSILRLFFTYIFLHYDLNHLLINILTQSFFLYSLERKFTTKIIAIIYFLIGLGGNILSNMVYWQYLKVGASSAIIGCFILYLMILFKEKDEILIKNKGRFFIFCIICNVLALPILRVFDYRKNLGIYKNYKIIVFYCLVFAYYLTYFVLLIIKTNDQNKNNEITENETFHWRILNAFITNNESFVDYIGRLGSLITGILFSFHFWMKNDGNTNNLKNYFKKFIIGLIAFYLIGGSLGCLMFDIPNISLKNC